MVRWCWVNFQCRGVLLIWIRVGQGPTALAVGAGGGCLDILSLVYHFSFLSPSLWETARYRLKYCLKGPLSLKQPTNHLCAWRTNEVLAGESRLLQDYHLKFSNNIFICSNDESGSRHPWGWSGGAKVLGKLSVPGRPTSLDDSRARAYCACSRCGWGLFGHFPLIYHFSFLSPSLWPIALAVGAGGVVWTFFPLIYHFSFLSPSLREIARYRLKYCLKGPLNPKQPTNQPTRHPKYVDWRIATTSSSKNGASLYRTCNHCNFRTATLTHIHRI